MAKKATKKTGRKRSSSSDSDDDRREHRKLKIEDFDVEKALREREVVAPPPPEPEPEFSLPPLPENDVEATMVEVEEEEVVPLAAVTTVVADRVSEATNGLLKEPEPPSASIARVTKEGAAAPPIPSDLLQLLSSE